MYKPGSKWRLLVIQYDQDNNVHMPGTVVIYISPYKTQTTASTVKTRDGSVLHVYNKNIKSVDNYVAYNYKNILLKR